LSVASGAAQMGAAVVLIERGLIMGKPEPFRFRPTSSTTSCCRTSACSRPIVYLLEVLTAVSLLLGIFVRLWALIGALQIVNL
jgi:hypothetical protein